MQRPERHPASPRHRPSGHPGIGLGATFLAAAGLFLAAHIASGAGYDGFEERAPTGEPGLEEGWREGEVRLPAPPRDGDLVVVPAVLLDSAYEVAIDRRSLRRGRDGVIRYTVVLSTRGGTRNVFYEGLRCAPPLVKVYAFGDRGGRLRSYPVASWREIERRGALAYRDTLRRHFFCEKEAIPRGEREILARLRRAQLPGGIAEERDGPGFGGGTER